MVAVTYAGLAVALLLVLPISIAALPATRILFSWGFYVAIVSAALSASLLRRELRRDPHQLCVFWVLVGAIMSLLSAGGVHDHPWIGWPGLAFCTSTWVASIVLLIRDALARDKVPSPILQRFRASQVCEVAGVQLAAEIADMTTAAQGDVELRVYTLLVAVASLGTTWLWGGGLRVRVPAGERSAGSVARVRRWFPLVR